MHIMLYYIIYLEPDPPAAVEVVEVGRRNISINVTDTDMPNGDIIGYNFHIMYKVYEDYQTRIDFLRKTSSGIYVLHNNIKPGIFLSSLIGWFLIGKQIK